ncbi:MAG: nucleoside triphosphate pyrophosphohydrolase [Sphingomonadaceae bacterium]|nr:nucleoside triphosphate pyrophosphohydrolase [Sphingomonadaceae bacterium]
MEPPADPLPAPLAQVARLIAVMRTLRDPVRGCEWDRAQTFATIVPYTIEEAYEVADAVARGDMAELKEELGDLLLQVVFHAQMAADAGLFDLGDVAEAIADKMERRHPHIFAGAAEAADWESVKAAEKPRAGALSGVAAALPALMRADKLQRRAARTGFDWPDAEGPCAKVAEELAELAAAASDDERTDEGGDLLFAVVNLIRHHGVDPESALRAANAKFERRFAAMEAAAGPAFAGLDLAAKEALWNAAKVAERRTPTGSDRAAG